MFIKKNNNSRKSYFMNLALMQAHKSLGNTKTNPSVGCVIVKNNFLIAAGCTSITGKPHAEKNAIFFNKKNIKNSTLYSTLEPCSNYGNTPPCVNLIIKSKIKKVFFSINDPDTRSYKKSELKFKNSKITIKKNINLLQSNSFYRSYIKFKKNDLPFVTGKIAISKDFYTVNKKKKWITNIYSRGRVHLLRSSHDCLLTTSNTIIKDNPRLNCRINGLSHTSPTRIILDKNLKISNNSKIIKTAKKYKTIIFHNNNKFKKIKLLKTLGINVYKLPVDKKKKFILLDVLKKIHLLGFSRVFLESGLKLTEVFLKNSLIDDFYLFISKDKIGSNGKNSFKKNMKFLSKKKKYNYKVNLLGDSMLSYKVK